MSLPPAPRAVVTGGASGLGQAIAYELAARGGRVVLADLHEDRLAQTAAEVVRRGGSAWTQICDVADPEAIERLADFAEEAMGGVDLMVNNAGVAVGGIFGQISLDDWRWIMDINLWGVIYGCQTFVPRMKAQGGGFILNVASSAGLLSPPMMAPYNVTKAGVVALSETLHAELGDDNIKVTVLCPTFFQTNLLDNLRSGGRAQDNLTKTARKLMQKSKVQAPDVAKAALAAVGEGELYCIPMMDGRMFWRLKRAVPAQFSTFTAAYRRRVMSKSKG